MGRSVSYNNNNNNTRALRLAWRVASMSPPRTGPSRTETPTTPTALARLSVLLLAVFASTAAASATATTATTATVVTLPSQILEVVPACATDCLATFVRNNYRGCRDASASSCPGSTPSFACLCEHTGANGFTIGEAALSCLTLEAESGSCMSEGGLANAFGAIKRAAYFMCQSGTAGTAFTAAQQTHRTIVATAVVGSAFAGNDAKTTTTTTVTAVSAHSTMATQLGFSTITTGSHTSTSSPKTFTTTSTHTTTSSHTSTHSPVISASALPTTLITAPFPSTSIPSTSIPSTSIPSISIPSTSSASTTTATTTTSSSTAGNTPPAPPPTRLSKAQIIGISIGSAAALVLAVVAYIGLRAVRRRRYRESEFFGDMGVFPAGRSNSNSNDKDSAGFSRLQETKTKTKPGTDAAPVTTTNSNSNGHELQISSPMHLQQPAKYQNRQASSFISPWHDKIASQQAGGKDTTGVQRITNPVPSLRPDLAGVAGVAGVAPNPYAQQTPYTMPATIRPVNNINIPPSTANTRQDTYAYNQSNGPRVLTTKALPARPSPAYERQPQPQPPSSYYTRGPALPADWRPRPPASQQQQQQQQQQQLQSLQTMIEEDDNDNNNNNNVGYVPPPPQGRIFRPPVMNRDSVVTEFAEDGEDEYSLRTSGRVSGSGSGRASRGALGASGRAPDSSGYRQDNSYPYEFEQPYMSPSIVPRPLALQQQQQSQGRPLAAQRLGDDRAAALQLGNGSSLQPPRQKQKWQRINSVIL